MANRAAQLRERIVQRDSSAVISQRARNSIEHITSEGVHILQSTIGPLHYEADDGTHEIDTTLVETATDEFHVADAEFNIEVRLNGERRVYPRKVDGEYIEFGPPQYRDGPWRNFQWAIEGEVSDDRITWDGPDASLIVKVQPSGVKVDLVLKNNTVNREIRWPRSVHGMIRADLENPQPGPITLVSTLDDAEVLTVPEPFVLDANRNRVEIDWEWGNQFVTFDPVDDTGLTYPLTIDPTTDTFQVASTSDDGRFTSTDLSTSYPQFGNLNSVALHSFWRYPSVTLDSGVTINDSYLTHTAFSSESGTTCNVTISAHDADDPAAPTSATEAANATRTTTQTSWSSIPGFSAESTYDTPSIASVIQEIVDRSGWASGNAIVIFHDNDGSSSNAYRSPYDYSDSSAKASVLTVEYTTSTDITVSAVTATGTGAASAPTISTTKTVSVEATTATGTGQAFTPTITTITTVAAVTATGTGQALAPTITTIKNSTISAVTATGTGQALVPTVTARDESIRIVTSRDPDFTVRLFGPLGTPEAGTPLDEITFSGIDTTFSINDEIPGGFGSATIGGVIQRDNQIVPAWLPEPVSDIVPFAHTVITAGMEPIWEGQAIKPETDSYGEIIGFEAVGYWSALNDHEFESSDTSTVTAGDVLRALVPTVAPILTIGSDSQFTDPQVPHELADFDEMTGGAIWDQISKEGDGLGTPVDLAVWHDRVIWGQRRQAPAVPHYVLQPGTPGVQITERPWDEMWARVRVRYTDSADNEQVTDWEETTITDAPRNRGKTLSGGKLTQAAAEQVAKTFLADHSRRRWGATVTLDDGRGMPTYDGGERPGYLIRPGEWVDVPGYHPMVILKRNYESASRRTSLTLDHQPRDWKRLLDRMKITTEYMREGLNVVTGGRQR